MSIKRHKGFTLIELLVAIGLLAGAITTLLGLAGSNATTVARVHAHIMRALQMRDLLYSNKVAQLYKQQVHTTKREKIPPSQLKYTVAKVSKKSPLAKLKEIKEYTVTADGIIARKKIVSHLISFEYVPDKKKK